MKRRFQTRHAPDSACVRVVAIVAQAHQMLPSEVHLDTNQSYVVRPRQVAWWVLRHMPGWSLSRIGMYLGARHHTTVLHGCLQVELERARNIEYRALTDRILADAVTGRARADSPAPAETIPVPDLSGEWAI